MGYLQLCFFIKMFQCLSAAAMRAETKYLCRAPCNLQWKLYLPHMHLSLPETDILTLKHESRIIRYCWDVLKVSTVFLSGTSSPVQCSNIGLKMRNKKCEILIHPTNISEIPTLAL